MKLRNLLLRYKWDPQRRSKAKYLQITVIHRGAPDNRKFISYEEIHKIGKKFLVIVDRNENTYIPLHRVTKVKNRKTGKILYSNPEK